MNETISVDLAVPLTPTPGLTRMWDAVRHAQGTVNAHLRRLASGQAVSLLEVARERDQRRPGRDGPFPTPGPVVRLGIPGTVQYVRQFRGVRDAMGWRQLAPASALDWMVRQTLREWQALAGAGPVPVSRLPGPWTPDRPAELHVDQGLLLVDGMTVEVARLGRLHADVRLLPDAYWEAVWAQRQRRLGSEQARLRRAETAWLDGGDRDASALALRLRARYHAAGIPLDGPVPRGETRPHGPAVTERVVIRQVLRPEEPAQWQVVWRFRVSAEACPRWVTDDVLGIDPGYRVVAGVASGHLRGVIPRPVTGDWQPPAWPPGVSLSEADESWARAAHRLALIERMRPAYAQLHALALSYRSVALEDTHWAGFEQADGWFGRYGREVGLRTTLEHLVALAPLHGVEVRYTPCHASSMSCAQCLSVGPRPRFGQPFHCARCGHSDHADVNAAAVHRERFLRGEGRAP